MKGAAQFAALALTLGPSLGCGSSARDTTDAGNPDASTCVPGGDGGYRDAPYANLSDYCLIAMTDAGLSPLPGAVPFDLNTPFFSDYAVKLRTVWMPPGTAATYDPTNVFTFPDGTIFTKSFGWSTAQSSPVMTWIETRVEMFVGGKWVLQAYRWNDAGTDATLDPGGEFVPLSVVEADGGVLAVNHLVPSPSQCAQCHDDNANNAPIGPKARQLNGSYTYPDGTTANQLAWWTDAGLLTGAPDPSLAPVLPVWNDPTTGTVEQRARAYLEGNCAHCHNPDGYASPQGLTLWASDQSPADYGVCDPSSIAFSIPGEHFVIVPDDPANSLLLYLMSSTTAGSLMPPLGRSVEDIEGVTLVGSWISGLDAGSQVSEADGGASTTADGGIDSGSTGVCG